MKRLTRQALAAALGFFAMTASSLAARDNCAYSTDYDSGGFIHYYSRTNPNTGALDYYSAVPCTIERDYYSRPGLICAPADDISEAMGFLAGGTYTCADGEAGHWTVQVTYVFGGFMLNDRHEPDNIWQSWTPNGQPTYWQQTILAYH